MKLFPRAEELKVANERIRELSVENANLKQVASRMHQAEATSNGLRVELEAAKRQLREQTSADLMLVSARIIMDTLKGNKPNPQDVALQRSLLNQQQMLGMAQSVTTYGYGGALGALGGIFGH